MRTSVSAARTLRAASVSHRQRNAATEALVRGEQRLEHGRVQRSDARAVPRLGINWTDRMNDISSWQRAGERDGRVALVHILVRQRANERVRVALQRAGGVGQRARHATAVRETAIGGVDERVAVLAGQVAEPHTDAHTVRQWYLRPLSRRRAVATRLKCVCECV